MVDIPEYRDMDAVICDGAVRSGKTLFDVPRLYVLGLQQLQRRFFCDMRQDYYFAAQERVTPLDTCSETVRFHLY